MKKRMLVGVVLLLYTAVFAQQQIDYRQVVFGNNYEGIEEINAEDFFTQYPQAKEVEKYGQGQLSEESQTATNEFYTARWGMHDEDWVSVTRKEFYFRVYEQKIGEETFYRLLCARYNPTDEDLLNWKRGYYEQQLLYKINEKELLHIGSYTHRFQVAFGNGNYSLYQGVEIIERKGKVIGVLPYMYAKYYYSGCEGEEGEWVYEHNGMYYLFDEVLTAEKTVVLPGMEKLPMWPPRPDLTIMEIEASEPLIDEKRPFMYTLQNAFDGNPATSYVENTEDDLMTVSIDMYKIGKGKKIMVINGYAQNETTYKNNNRIKELSHKSISKHGTVTEYSTKKINFQDNTLTKQMLDWWGGSFFTVTDIYKGLKYSDTCLAELDFYINEFGWLFGGPNE